MKLLLISAGSRGDVEPFAALARRAQRAGHQVRLAIPDRSGVDTSELDTVSLHVDYSALIESQGVSPLAAMRSFSTVVRPTMRGVIVNAVTAALEYQPDAIVYHPKILSAPMIADELGIPHVLVELVPAVTPTTAFAAPGTVNADWGRLNRITYSAAQGAARMFARELREAQQVLGSHRAAASRPRASLVPISPHVLPRPSDWPDSVHLTGAWLDTAPGNSRPEADAELEEFLAHGPTIYAGFGSMATGDAESRGRVIAEAARATNHRLVIATGLGGISVPRGIEGDDILVRSSVDHARVLPHVRAAVHHGGIGTVHAAARAGTPSVVVPFIADQPFWGAQLHRQGLAPRAIPQRALTASRLAHALASASEYAHNVERVRRAMETEDGLAVALEVLERGVDSPSE